MTTNVPLECRPSRRNFLKFSAAVATGISAVSTVALLPEPAAAQDNDGLGDRPASRL
jgi:TAT (twin-arginine translocation) pathway signal sequence